MACSGSEATGIVDLPIDDFLCDFNIADKYQVMEMIDQEAKKLKLYFAGPVDSPYHNGSFEVEVTFGDNYPSVPHIVFLTPIWNGLVDPNTFEVCCEQGAKITLPEAIVYIERVLKSVNTNADSSCWKIASFWASEFAGKPGTEEDKIHAQEIEQMVDMGFEQMKALVALSHCNWDMELATEHILQIPPQVGLLPIQQVPGPSNEGVAAVAKESDDTDDDAAEEEK